MDIIIIIIVIIVIVIVIIIFLDKNQHFTVRRASRSIDRKHFANEALRERRVLTIFHCPSLTKTKCKMKGDCCVVTASVQQRSGFVEINREEQC